MHRPVLVTPAAGLPVSVAEAIRQCRITIDEGDDVALAEVTGLLEGYIGAAVDHLNGWTGILGACVGVQAWRQDFDGFARCLPLPLGPFVGVDSVSFKDAAGVSTDIASENYFAATDAGGTSVLRFRASYSFPSVSLFETGAVSVTYRAGYQDVPKAIKQAILLMVGAWYENREETVIGVSAAGLPNAVAVDRLIHPYRRNVL